MKQFPTLQCPGRKGPSTDKTYRLRGRLVPFPPGAGWWPCGWQALSWHPPVAPPCRGSCRWPWREATQPRERCSLVSWVQKGHKLGILYQERTGEAGWHTARYVGDLVPFLSHPVEQSMTSRLWSQTAWVPSLALSPSAVWPWTSSLPSVCLTKEVLVSG